ncbi:ABC transporter substrate-binding protein [Pseudofrankia inefficax]|uniref:Leucine-binding protein domain-containing protein n=1 Tax=Pseudofrankia inefficax (strain DSM 45817 / CECT 9037 / DDB 130130 / EuI1c) TaxID=298654 RepID=E3J2C1_PSEI1|nr:ABC transporter substrate-binding protein [Pseudofrankia inefficax]ADP79293.1 hypothetical protein FraEuI1c_1221 [Pseudofrankia inefficax]
MIFRRRRARAGNAAFAAVLAWLPIAIAACGTSSSTSNRAAACPTPAPGVTATSIKVGFIYPDSGPAEIVSVFGAARGGVEARIDQQNAQGGVNGRKLDLVWGDDRSDPATFSLVAGDMVHAQQAFGLISSSIVLDKSADWLAKENVPITGFATSAIWSDYPNLFHTGNRFNSGGSSVLGDFVKARGGTKALVLVDPNVASSQGLVAQSAASLQSRGIQVLGQVAYTQGAGSAARVAEQVKKSGADTLVGAAQSDAFIDIYAQAKALGANIIVAVDTSSASPALLARRGSDMPGMTFPSTTAAQGSPAMIAYQHAMSTYAPEVTDQGDQIAIGGYTIADEMIEGLRRAGPCPTREAFIRNLREMTNFTAGGLMAPVDLSQPKLPTLCESFLNVDRSGRSLVLVQPPAALDHDGYWCGVSLQ